MNPDGALKLKKLAQVALLVLTLPHSNAEEEQVFSMITKNKTKFMSNFKLDGTLSCELTCERDEGRERSEKEKGKRRKGKNKEGEKSKQ